MWARLNFKNGTTSLLWLTCLWGRQGTIGKVNNGRGRACCHEITKNNARQKMENLSNFNLDFLFPLSMLSQWIKSQILITSNKHWTSIHTNWCNFRCITDLHSSQRIKRVFYYIFLMKCEFQGGWHKVNLRAEHYMDCKTKWKKSFHPYENIIRPQAYVDEYLGKYSKHSRPVQ